MAKGDDKRVRDNITQSQDRSNTQYGMLWDRGLERSDVAKAGEPGERSYLLNGLQGMSETGGISADDSAALRKWSTPGGLSGGASSGGAAGFDAVSLPTAGAGSGYFDESEGGFREASQTGLVDLAKLEEALPYFRDLAGKEGGFDPTRLSRINSSSQGLKDIGDTGGIPPDQLAKLRATIETLRTYGITGGLSPEEIARFRDPGYEQFANTGGFSDDDIALGRRTNAGATQSLARAFQRQMEQQARINPGAASFSAASARGQRELGHGVGQAASEGELNLQRAIREGKQWGIAGRASQEAALDQLLSGNRINATNAASSQGTNLENSLVSNKVAGLTGSGTLDVATQNAINNARVAGATGITNTQQGAQGLVQRGRLAGLEGLFGIGNARLGADQSAAAGANSAAAANAGLAEQGREFDWNSDFANRQFGAGIDQYLISQGQGGKLAGLTGLQNLYGQSYGPQDSADTNLLNVLNSQTGANQNYIGARTQASQIPGKWQTGFNNVLAGGQMVAGLAGAFTGGGNRGTTDPVSRKPGDIKV